MNQPSITVRALEVRIRALEIQYARLNELLRAVGAALGGSERHSANGGAPSEARVDVSQPGDPSDKRGETSRSTASRRRARPTANRPAAAAKSTGLGKAAPGPGAKKTPHGAQAGSPRKWFDKGEAVELFRSILKRPMLTRDLMVRVIAAKRKAQLPKEDLGRFKWAVHAALKEAIGAKSIVRLNDGTIAVAPANARVAGKSPGKAKK